MEFANGCYLCPQMCGDDAAGLGSGRRPGEDPSSTASQATVEGNDQRRPGCVRDIATTIPLHQAMCPPRRGIGPPMPRRSRSVNAVDVNT